LRCLWCREILKDAQLITEGVELLILKFSTMITPNGTNVVAAGVL